jgi:hypothetical protein
LNLTLDADDSPQLRREMRIHIGLAAGFSLTAVGLATAYVPALLQGQLPVGTAILAAVTELGFVSLIWQEVRAALRTKRELNLLSRRPEEQL